MLKQNYTNASRKLVKNATIAFALELIFCAMNWISDTPIVPVTRSNSYSNLNQTDTLKPMLLNPVFEYQIALESELRLSPSGICNAAEKHDSFADIVSK